MPSPSAPAALELSPGLVVAAGYAGANLVCFSLFAWDKAAARRGARPAARIRERTLHLWALATGGLGAFAALASLRHKSLHASFWLSAFGGFSAHLAFWIFRHA